jgi:hypothetical protein
MRAYFELFNVIRYVFIDEAWRLDTTDLPPCERDAALDFCREHGARAHLRRVEIVLFAVEDEMGMLQGYRVIKLRLHCKPRLGPLILDPNGGHYEGRMIGLLPPKGAMQ